MNIITGNLLKLDYQLERKYHVPFQLAGTSIL